MEPLTTIYGTSHSTDNVALEHLMVAYLHDLCQTVGDFISDEDALAIARKPGKDYIQMVEMLRGILTENV
jgi:hypothetical protein